MADEEKFGGDGGDELKEDEIKRKMLKVVIMGDRNVGKSSLLYTYLNSVFPDKVPTMLENLSKNIESESTDTYEYELVLWDTVFRDDDAAPLFPLHFIGGSVYILVYSVIDPKSFQSIHDVFLPMIHKNTDITKGVPMILAGLKTDLRDDSNVLREMQQRDEFSISYEDGMELAKKMKFVWFAECSSKLNLGVKELVDEAIKIGLEPESRIQNDKNCTIF